VDKQLNFDKHVMQKCKLANAKLQALKRLSKYLTKDCKLAIVRSFIVSHFIYCLPLLHFSSKQARSKMEKTLYRGLRYTFDDYESNYDELLQKAEMCTVELQREKAIVTEMFKCLHGLGPIYMKELFQVQTTNSRRGPTFKIPRVRTTRFGTHSLRYRGPQLWNELSKDIKYKETLQQFKDSLIEYKGSQCKCNQCKAAM
jgi:hypothetical protein